MESKPRARSSEKYSSTSGKRRSRSSEAALDKRRSHSADKYENKTVSLNMNDAYELLRDFDSQVRRGRKIEKDNNFRKGNQQRKSAGAVDMFKNKLKTEKSPKKSDLESWCKEMENFAQVLHKRNELSAR